MRILHFSDFHLNGPDRIELSRRNFQYFLDAVKKVHTEKPIDLIIFTGDMIDKGGKDYHGSVTEALNAFKEEVIDKLLLELGLSKSRFAFVCGNHDIDRKVVTAEENLDIEKRLNSDQTLSEYMDNQYLECTIKRTAEFKTFQKSFYEGIPEYRYAPFESTLLLEIEDSIVGINCLDTSWRCYSDYDQGHILMGRKQLIHADDHIHDCDLKIAVAHHDYSWMAQFEQNALGKLISGSYKIYFCGHNHGYSEKVREYEDKSQVVCITAPGLLYANSCDPNPEYRNGFMIVDYDFITQSIDLYKYIQGLDDKFNKDLSYNGNTGVYHKDLFPYHSIIPIKSFLKEFRKEIHSALITAPVLEELIAKIKGQDMTALQIIALSGLGKTRLIFEAFNEEHVREDVFYCDYVPQIRPEVEEFLRKTTGEKVTLVVDNCPYDELEHFIVLRNRLGSNTRIIGLSNLFYNQQTVDGCEQIAITPDQLKEAVASYIEQKIPEKNNQTEIRDIKKISDGFPAMAIRLVGAFLETGKYDLHSLDSLLPKILSIDRDTPEDEIKVLSSLSLFQPVPIGNVEAYNFIINNACITSLPGYGSIDKRRLFNKVIKKYDKSIIENTGTWLNIRPFPLAVMLLSRWFDEMDSDTIVELVSDIEKFRDDSIATYSSLKEGMCERINYMQDCDRAQELLDELTKGPFLSEKVVCSDMGSRLFLAMSTVNPVAVASCLFSLFKDKETEWLKNNVNNDARRNLMWALEKLCFDKESYQYGVKVMAMFSLAENESFANNASGQIKQLFHIYLPGTQASLRERFKTLLYFKGLGNGYQSLVMGLLNSAFQNGDFVRSGGAEKFGIVVKEEYYPSNAEIFEYWEDCRDMLITWLQEDSSIALSASTIVEKHIMRWCSNGLTDFMSPFIEKIVGIRENNWPEFYEILVRHKEFLFEKVTNQTAVLLDSWMNQLKPHDFVSKLLMLRFSNTIDYHQPLDDIKIALDAKYRPFVDEFLKNELYKEFGVVHNLCTTPDFYDTYFCTSLNENANDQQVIDLLSTLLEVIKKEELQNLKYFFFGICTALRNRKTFDVFIKEIFESGNQQLAIHILANCEDETLKYFYYLLGEYKSRKITDDYIGIYLQYIGICTNEMMTKILETSIDEFPGKSKELLNFVKRFIFLADIKGNTDLFPYFKHIVLSYNIEPQRGNDNYEFSHFTSELLKNDDDTEFAMKLATKLIDAMNTEYLHGNFEGIWSVLLEKYGDVVWPVFSRALVSDDYIRFYLQVRHEIGSGSGFGSGPMFRIGDEKIKKFCKDYPSKAPLIVANLCPVFESVKEEDGSIRTERFSDIALWLFDEYGKDRNVLDEFHANLGSFFWTGSTIPYHERNISCFKPLLSHSNASVREWASNCIKYEEEMLQREVAKEDYMRLRYN